MSLLFGTDNIVFVPSGGALQFFDVQRWRVHRIDTKHSLLRMRPEGFARFEPALRLALEALRNSPRYRDRIAQVEKEAVAHLATLNVPTIPAGGRIMGASAIHEALDAPRLLIWARVTDGPAESFAEEDYDEHEGPLAGGFHCHPVYGSVGLARFDGFELALPERGDGSAFALDVPAASGLAGGEPGAFDPLPLVDEYCGARGASSRGCTVNIEPRAELAVEHMAATPLCRMGPSLFATLYFHLSAIPDAPPVIQRLKRPELAAVEEVLRRSHFEAASSGPMWRIYRRGDEDAVHCYFDLPGKESEGLLSMPPFVLVALAGGSTDLDERADLLEALLSPLR